MDGRYLVRAGMTAPELVALYFPSPLIAAISSSAAFSSTVDFPPLLEFDGQAYDAVPEGRSGIQWNLAAHAAPEAHRDGHLYATLVFELDATYEEPEKAARSRRFLRVVTIGGFRYALREEPLDEARRAFFRMLHLNGAAYLYGNLRPFVRTLTLTAGYRELLLPSADVASTFADTVYDEAAWAFPEAE